MSKNNSLKKAQREGKKMERRLQREFEAREVPHAARRAIDRQIGMHQEDSNKMRGN